MIDLHTHTTASDGTYSPAELVQAAADAGIAVLAITDHDTFAGYDEAVASAGRTGVRLVCGIELSTKLLAPQRKTVHLLGYFITEPPTQEFRGWLAHLQAARRDRNVRLAAKLRTLNVDITVEEVEAMGRSLAGRPHFARLLVAKGYAASIPDAFRSYLDESAPGYVDRDEPSLQEGIRRIHEGGGISSLAHPIRLGKRDHTEEESLIADIHAMGLRAIEAYHSDQDALDTERYLNLARKLGAQVTGGSDFHGDNKPGLALGMGYGGLRVPLSVFDQLTESIELR